MYKVRTDLLVAPSQSMELKNLGENSGTTHTLAFYKDIYDVESGGSLLILCFLQLVRKDGSHAVFLLHNQVRILSS